MAGNGRQSSTIFPWDLFPRFKIFTSFKKNTQSNIRNPSEFLTSNVQEFWI